MRLFLGFSNSVTEKHYNLNSWLASQKIQTQNDKLLGRKISIAKRKKTWEEFAKKFKAQHKNKLKIKPKCFFLLFPGLLVASSFLYLRKCKMPENLTCRAPYKVSFGSFFHCKSVGLLSRGSSGLQQQKGLLAHLSFQS